MPVSKGRKKRRSRPAPLPPSPKAKKAKQPSPTWYVATMFGLMGLGVVMVVARYVFFTGSQALLLVGLLAIAVGFVMTTNYR